MKLLLDTHILLWWIFDEKSLSKRSKRLLSQESSEWVLSVASLWEIAIKLNLGKLKLGMSFADFAKEFIQDRPIEILPIKFNHLSRYTQLPFHHRDPFDRLLIAQSQSEGIPLLTQDKSFRAYRLPRFKRA